MKFSEQWLREWVNPEVDTQRLADQLTMAGLEVNSVISAAPEFTGVCIGEIIAVTPHPDAKRLNCCRVDVGKKEPLDIICGGVNVREGLHVPVAVVGAVLPGDFKIKKAELRGLPSHGMICSSNELGLEEGAKGHIMELREDAPVGENFRDYLQLNDQIIDIDLTPNRGDCLSIRGVAREVAIANQLTLSLPDIPPQSVVLDASVPMRVNDEVACPRYAGRVIHNIRQNVSTPLWMAEKLRRSGLRCIHPVVDVLNYVMLEIGQPMHAFDLGSLSGGIHVRRAKKGETLTLLDEQKIQCDESVLVISDSEKVLALAGIMGGSASAVQNTTQDIFLESAFFDPNIIRKTAKKYALQTDSSYRFERGVDATLQADALERATALLLEIVGGEAGSIVEVACEKTLPQPTTVNFRSCQIKRLLGIELEETRIESILLSLGMELRSAHAGWMVQAPSYRFDISQEADLVEEIARIYGYDQIVPSALHVDADIPSLSEGRPSRSRLRTLLIDQGYSEAITYSFVDPKRQASIEGGQPTMVLQNPISNEMAEMRRSLWPGLIEAAMHNIRRQIPRVRLFEMGLCFEPASEGCVQTEKLAMVAAGTAYSEQWGKDTRAVDFYDVKANVTMLLTNTKQLHRFRWLRGTHPALHPGQSAALYQEERLVGHLGMLHPRLAAEWGLSSAMCLFEIELAELQRGVIPQFQPISKYPTVRRDLAIIVDQSISASAICEAISKNAGQLMSNVQIFDMYQGEGIEKGKKSLALGLTFQDPSRTLIDTEINEVIQSVVATLVSNFNAKLRA